MLEFLSLGEEDEGGLLEAYKIKNVVEGNIFLPQKSWGSGLACKIGWQYIQDSQKEILHPVHNKGMGFSHLL